MPIIREALDALGIPIVGAAEHEADDVIGTLATRATLPVDIVTGDRDLFQLVDDAREVRVIYTARGMSNLEIVTDAIVVAKYGVLPEPVRRLRDAARRLVRRPSRCRGHRREDRGGTPAPRTATSPASSRRPRRARGCRPASAPRSWPGSPTSRSPRRSSRSCATSTSPSADARLRPLDETREAGCRGPRRALGAGHRDDPDHRRRSTPSDRSAPSSRRTPPGVRATAPRIRRLPGSRGVRSTACRATPGTMSGPRFRPPPARDAVRAGGRRVRSIQVPATIAISLWQHVPPPCARAERRAGRGIRSRPPRRAALARPDRRRRRRAHRARPVRPARRGPAVRRPRVRDRRRHRPRRAAVGAHLGGAGVAHRDRRERRARRRAGIRSASRSRPSALALCFGIGEGIRARLEHGADPARSARRAAHATRAAGAHPHRPRAPRRPRPLAQPDRGAVRRRPAPLRPRAGARPRGAREHPGAQRHRARRGPRRAVVPPRRRAGDLHRAAHPAAAARAASGARRRSAAGSASTIELDDRLAGDLPPSATQTTAYRIVQEALTNVVRHSAASRATIVLDRDADRPRRHRADDGSGIPADAIERGGLRGMRERAELVGRRARRSRRPRAAAPTVTARLPWTGARHDPRRARRRPPARPRGLPGPARLRARHPGRRRGVRRRGAAARHPRDPRRRRAPRHPHARRRRTLDDGADRGRSRARTRSRS